MITLTELVTEHKAQLGPDATEVFNAPDDGDYKRHIELATLRIDEKRPYVVDASVTVQAEQASYPAPADLLRLWGPTWGLSQRQHLAPWDPRHPGRMPRLRLASVGGVRSLLLDPAPTNHQVAQCGETYTYRYYAKHQVDDLASTVDIEDKRYLLMAALIEAVRELASRNVLKPIQLHRGVGAVPTSATPLELYRTLTEQWEALSA